MLVPGWDGGLGFGKRLLGYVIAEHVFPTVLFQCYAQCAWDGLWGRHNGGRYCKAILWVNWLSVNLQGFSGPKLWCDFLLMVGLICAARAQ